MIKICFQKFNDGTEWKLICAHEKDYEGSGCYISMPYDDFEKLGTEQKLEAMNDLIIAVTKAYEVKKDINFSDYQRQ